jgi:hypothetical protein
MSDRLLQVCSIFHVKTKWSSMMNWTIAWDIAARVREWASRAHDSIEWGLSRKFDPREDYCLALIHFTQPFMRLACMKKWAFSQDCSGDEPP